VQVGIPSALGPVLGVADPITKHRPFAAYIAYLSHLSSLGFNPDYALNTEKHWYKKKSKEKNFT